MGRPSTGRKAIPAPRATKIPVSGYLKKKGRGRLKVMRPKMIPPASQINCLTVISPMRRNL